MSSSHLLGGCGDIARELVTLSLSMEPAAIVFIEPRGPLAEHLMGQAHRKDVHGGRAEMATLKDHVGGVMHLKACPFFSMSFR